MTIRDRCYTEGCGNPAFAWVVYGCIEAHIYWAQYCYACGASITEKIRKRDPHQSCSYGHLIIDVLVRAVGGGDVEDMFGNVVIAGG